MRKVFAYILCTAMLLGCLGACSSQKDDEDVPEPDEIIENTDGDMTDADNETQEPSQDADDPAGGETADVEGEDTSDEENAAEDDSDAPEDSSEAADAVVSGTLENAAAYALKTAAEDAGADAYLVSASQTDGNNFVVKVGYFEPAEAEVTDSAADDMLVIRLYDIHYTANSGFSVSNIAPQGSFNTAYYDVVIDDAGVLTCSPKTDVLSESSKTEESASAEDTASSASAAD